MQRHAIHGRRHAVFANAPVDVAPLAVVDVKDTQIRRARVIRPGQVSRAANGFGQHKIDRLKHFFGTRPRRQFRSLFAHLFLERPDHVAEPFGHVAVKGAGELGLPVRRERGKTRFPFLPRAGAASADLGPHRFDIARNVEGLGRPAPTSLGSGVLICIRQGAVAFRGVLCCVSKRDMRLAGDHCGLVLLRFRLADRGVDGFGVVTVDLDNLPAGRFETLRLVGPVGQIHRAVDGDVVIVPENDQARQLMTPRQRDRLLADALHQAAVARDAISMVIDDLLAVMRAQDLFGHGKARGIGDPLSQRSCRGFDAGAQKVLGVACRYRAKLAEVADLLDRHIGIARQVQKRIKQHRPMACRQDKPIPVRPLRSRRVEFQVLFKQNGGDICHADGHAGMPGLGCRHGVERERPDGSGFLPVIGICGAEGVDIHEL